VKDLDEAILAALAVRNGECELLELAQIVWSRGASIASLLPTVELLVARGLVVQAGATGGGRYRLSTPAPGALAGHVRDRS
jgi:malonyl CoA-acyl carrier protein transacylase